MSNIISAQQMRAVWKGLNENAVAKGLPAPQTGFLRVEMLADKNSSTYIFNFKQNGSTLSTEQRLNDNDAFFAKYARLRIKEEDPAKPGSGQYQTFANATAIAPVLNEVTQEDLDSLWNSKLRIVIDQKEVLKGLDMNASRCVNTTQQSAGTNRSESHPYDGYIDFNNLIRLGGSASIEVALILPAYSRLIQHVTSNKRIYLAIEFYGFLVPQGSALGSVNLNY